MKISEYTPEDEEVYLSVKATYEDSDGIGGKLALTSHRLVYKDGTMLLDLDPSRVESVRYEPGGHETLSLAGALPSFVLLQETGKYLAVAVVGAAFLILVIAVGLWSGDSPKDTLEIQTPTEAYQFTSREDGLAEIGSALQIV